MIMEHILSSFISTAAASATDLLEEETIAKNTLLSAVVGLLHRSCAHQLHSGVIELLGCCCKRGPSMTTSSGAMLPVTTIATHLAATLFAWNTSTFLTLCELCMAMAA